MYLILFIYKVYYKTLRPVHTELVTFRARRLPVDAMLDALLDVVLDEVLDEVLDLLQMPSLQSMSSIVHTFSTVKEGQTRYSDL